MENEKSNSLLVIIWSVFLCISTSVKYREIVEIYEAFGLSEDKIFSFETLDIVFLIISSVLVGFIYKKCSRKKSNIICFLIILTWILFFLWGSLVMRVYNGSFLFDAYGM